MPVRLFTPGPAAVHPSVLQTAAQPLHYHRHRNFRALMERVQERLRWLFQTRSPVVVLTCSATGAHEAVARMLHEPGTEAMVCVHGRFGHRWAALLERLGVRVHRLEVAWGENISPNTVSTALGTNPNVRSVWIVHSETSTGVLSPAAEIIAAVRRIAPEVVICLDAVSSLGIHPVLTDQWDADVVIASSQKGVGGLPGLALVAIGYRARKHFIPKPSTLYFDLHVALEALEYGTTPYTPAITLVQALDAALNLIEQEGLPARWERYACDAATVRNHLQQAGYHLFGQCNSNAVTVAWVPRHSADLVEQLEQRYGFIIARGQEKYRSLLFRIGHCGWYEQEDLQHLLLALLELSRSSC